MRTKTKVTHTPGPWVAECVGTGGNYDNPTDVYEINNGGTRIAEYLKESDAHLIAAAPDMLEALEQIHDLAETPPTLKAADVLLREFRYMAKSAIAKAKSGAA